MATGIWLLAACPEKVFADFAEASLRESWLTQRPDVVLTVLEFDFRIGGAASRIGFQAARRWSSTESIGQSNTARPPFSWNIEPPDVHDAHTAEDWD